MKAIFKTLCGCEKWMMIPFPVTRHYHISICDDLKFSEPDLSPSAVCCTTRIFELVEVKHDVATYKEMPDKRIFQ